MGDVFYLCFLVFTGLSQEKLYVNVGNIQFYERENDKTSMGKERLTKIHLVNNTVISVREDLDDIIKKTHSCVDKVREERRKK